MRSIVISALFEALPDARLRVPALQLPRRRGQRGRARRGPRRAARRRRRARRSARRGRDRPPARAGRLVVRRRHGARASTTRASRRWVGIAPPLRFRAERRTTRSAHDPRPKLLVLAAHDEFRAPAEVEAEVADVDEHARRDRSRARATSSWAAPIGSSTLVADFVGASTGDRLDREHRAAESRASRGSSFGARSPSARPRGRSRTWRGRRPRTRARARRTRVLGVEELSVPAEEVVVDCAVGAGELPPPVK